jgi:hypothetical protein
MMEPTKYGKTMFKGTYSILFECQYNNLGESLVSLCLSGRKRVFGADSMFNLKYIQVKRP